nr:ribonuclease H-like domain-containing protein [Tanacetum cinerariifolium]
MCNSIIVTWILNSLSPEIFAGAKYVKSAFKIWNDLKETYDKVDGSAVFNLHKNINSLNQNGSTLVDYYNKLKSMWKQFDAMFLMDLDESFLAIRSNLLTREPLPCVKTAFFVINGPNLNLKCTNFNKTGHTMDRCFELIGYLVGYVKRNFNSNSRPVTRNNASTDVHSNGVSSNNSTTGNSLVSLSSEQLARLMNLLNENGVSTTNANMAGKVKYRVKRVVNYANLNHDNYYFASALNKSVEPTCYEEAISDSNSIDAMNVEIEALNENHTWEIIDLPPNRKAIGNKWIYKINYKSDVDIDIYKARLVVKDVNNAFMYGDYDEDIYMTIPKGFSNKYNKKKVCKLVKSLYGPKQAPRKWNKKLVSVLKENGFVQSNNDHSLLTKSKTNKFIAFLIYVDDIIITENCMSEIDKFKSFLKSKFKIKDLGHLKYFLGIEVIKIGKDLCLSQWKYFLELLEDYGLVGCKPVSTHMEPNLVLPYVPTKDDLLFDNITRYQKLLGKLMHVLF